jgi:hypothetical protein
VHIDRSLVAPLVAVLVLGCLPGVSNADVEKVHRQAQAALEQWADAVAKVGAPPVIPVGQLTQQVGDWEEGVADNNKRALMGGLVFTNSPLDGEARDDGEVQWPDGSTVNVPVMAAQEAIVAIATTAETTCDDCSPMIATKGTLISGPIQTSRGPASAPIWSFDIEGTQVKVTRVAIENAITVPSLPWDPIFPTYGLDLESATGSAQGTELTVAFTGAPEAGDKPCGEDYTAEAVESDLAIVVLVTRHPRLSVGGACSAVGARRTASAKLAKPLGDRTVLRVTDGQPVPTTVLP